MKFYYVRVTEIIRIRQKCSIKAIFVAFAVALLAYGKIFNAVQAKIDRFKPYRVRLTSP